MFSNLKADELSWFANNFMLDFAKTSIAIENFSNETYDCFYAEFWITFKNFLEHRMLFDADGNLLKSYSYFYDLIEGYIPDIPDSDDVTFLSNIPSSGAVCIECLSKLRELEERQVS
ncbi:MAG: hypothetical protein LBD23_09510 [Oscillospiraceae bacterium]|jgi:hypothetical protein|nr:hypothetical protein [Oscillospiraceae bacterium]